MTSQEQRPPAERPPATATGYPQQPSTGAPHPANGYPPPSAAGYPYAAAPPPHPNYYYNTNNPNPNPYYYQQQPQGPFSPQRLFLRRLLAVIVALFVIVAVILFIIWLVVRPRVPDFRLNSLSLSHFNASASDVSGNWTALVTVYNPNSKMHVYYEEIDVFAFYNSEDLGQNRLAPFDQGTKSETNITASVMASQSYVDDWIVSRINQDKARGSVKFNVRFVAVAHFKTGGWRTRRRLVRVFCDGVPVAVSSNSTGGLSTGGPKDCEVSI